MTRLLDWFRFQGWRNAYWREDAAMSRCDHTDVYYDQIGGLCVLCGKPMGAWQTSTSATGTTARYKFWIKQ